MKTYMTAFYPVLFFSLPFVCVCVCFFGRNYVCMSVCLDIPELSLRHARTRCTIKIEHSDGDIHSINHQVLLCFLSYRQTDMCIWECRELSNRLDHDVCVHEHIQLRPMNNAFVSPLWTSHVFGDETRQICNYTFFTHVFLPIFLQLKSSFPD